MNPEVLLACNCLDGRHSQLMFQSTGLVMCFVPESHLNFFLPPEQTVEPDSEPGARRILLSENVGGCWRMLIHTRDLVIITAYESEYGQHAPALVEDCSSVVLCITRQSHGFTCKSRKPVWGADYLECNGIFKSDDHVTPPVPVRWFHICNYRFSLCPLFLIAKWVGTCIFCHAEPSWLCAFNQCFFCVDLEGRNANPILLTSGIRVTLNRIPNMCI